MYRCAPLICSLFLAASCTAGLAQETLLRPGENLGPLRYNLGISAAYGGDLAGTTLEAAYSFVYRTFTASDRGELPALIVYEQCTATATTAEGRSHLPWGLEGEDVLAVLGPDSLLREVPVPLPGPGASSGADALAAYAATLWAIPYPAEAVAPGESFLIDVRDEPSLAGPVLVHRRVVGELVSVEPLAGRQVAVLSAQIEQTLAPDHPALTGEALIEVRVAVDALTGVVLGVDLVETSETATRENPDTPVVVMDPLRCRIRLEGGPELDELLALP